MARKNKRESWEEEEEIIWVSRSELKRDMEALQKLGETLVELKPSVLAKFPLDDELRDAISDAKRFEKEAKRRQMQLIGKMMRSREPEPIQAALDLLNNKHGQQSIALKKMELLRDQIVEQGDTAITSLIDEYPTANKQKLRQLARQAKKEKAAEKPAKAYRELFQYIKALKADD